MTQTLWTTLLRPLEPVLASMSDMIDHKYQSKKLLWADFVQKLLFGYLFQVSSLRQLVLELETNDLCRDLELSYTPFSTLKDGFSRFPSALFKDLFAQVLAQAALKTVGAVAEMGVFRVIDGSLFPTLVSMSWTTYRKTKNACKLHLSFELNRMIATEFWVGSGNSSERQFFVSVLEKGLTYIADRGYLGFDLIDKVMQAKAYFILRGKDKALYKVVETLALTGDLPLCFLRVTDELVQFSNDKEGHRLRMITFTVAGSYFRLVTNRFDLSTLQIITLYAYRWQIELFFKYVKRTLKGLHLLNQSENGVEIQFYVLLTLAVLTLQLKQECQAQAGWGAEKGKKSAEKTVLGVPSASEWIKKVAEIFYVGWKISKEWLLVLKNSLSKPLERELLMRLNWC